MKVTYKDKIMEIQDKISVKELFENEIKSSENKITVCKINGLIKSLNYIIEDDVTVELLDMSTKDGMRIYLNGLLYILGKAFYNVYPKALLTINYQLSGAMFCQIDNMKVTDEIIANVKKEMNNIIKKDLLIEEKIMTKQEAIEFYEKEKTLRGILQIDNIKKDTISLYYCEDYYNYFYGEQIPSTGYITLFDINKYMDGFLLRYPSRDNTKEITPYIQKKKLQATIDEYDNINKVLNINTVYKLNKKIKENNYINYVLLSEVLHENKIAEIANKICKQKECKMVLIAGPSSSGKTTFAKRLGIQLRIHGLKPVTISVDDYFIDREDTPKDEYGNYNFEDIEVVDIELFNKNLIKLMNGQEIDAPTFNFVKGRKEYNGNKMRLNDDEILIIEGIHCLNDRLTCKIDSKNKFKIYISALTVLNIDYYNRISSTDTRMIRRIIRDNRTRGFNATQTLEKWYSVAKGENKNIFPYQETADAMFNSSLFYELAVLKDEAIPLLEKVDRNSDQYNEAMRLLELLTYFESIPKDCVPRNSLLLEFIGNSIFE